MSLSSKHKKGFTLVEILLVVFMIGLLATTAIGSYINSTETFGYIGAYKDVLSTFKTARAYAITNKKIDDIETDRYGVCVSETGVVLFMDSGDKDFDFDPETGGGAGGCQSVGQAAEGAKFDNVLEKYVFSKYKISALNNQKQSIQLPILIFYELKKGKTSVIKADKTAFPLTEKYLSFVFEYPDKKLKKYVVLFLLSGLAEEYDNLNQI